MLLFIILTYRLTEIQISHVFSSKSTMVDCYQNDVATVTTIKMNVHMRFPASKKKDFSEYLIRQDTVNLQKQAGQDSENFLDNHFRDFGLQHKGVLAVTTFNPVKKVSLSTKISSKSSARMRMTRPLPGFLRIEIRKFSQSALPNACSLILVPKLEQSRFFHIFHDSPHLSLGTTIHLPGYQPELL